MLARSLARVLGLLLAVHALRLEIPLHRGHEYDVRWNGTHVSMRDVDTGHLVLDATVPPACRGRPLDARMVRHRVLRIDVHCAGEKRVPRGTPRIKQSGTAM